MIRFQCSQRSRVLRVSEEFAGQADRCPGCSGAIAIPAAFQPQTALEYARNVSRAINDPPCPHPPPSVPVSPAAATEDFNQGSNGIKTRRFSEEPRIETRGVSKERERASRSVTGPPAPDRRPSADPVPPPLADHLRSPRKQEGGSASRLRLVPGALPAFLAALALLVALFAVALQFVREPLGWGLSAYDFGSPKSALDSQLLIEANQDIRAAIDLQRLQTGPEAEEKLDTLKVHKQSKHEGKVILFITYEQNGIKRYDTLAYERDLESGLWLPDLRFSPTDIDDPRLRAAVNDWRGRTGRVEEND